MSDMRQDKPIAGPRDRWERPARDTLSRAAVRIVVAMIATAVALWAFNGPKVGPVEGLFLAGVLIAAVTVRDGLGSTGAVLKALSAVLLVAGLKGARYGLATAVLVGIVAQLPSPRRSDGPDSSHRLRRGLEFRSPSVSLDYKRIIAEWDELVHELIGKPALPPG